MTALNLVEVEFARESKVIEAWKKYLEHHDGLMSPFPTDPKALDPFFKERNRRLTKLLHEMGKTLGFDIEQLDIMMGNYTPQAWVDEEHQGKFLRELAIDLLSGRRGLPVVPHNPNPDAGAFPPRPSDRPLNGGQQSGVQHHHTHSNDP